MRGMFPLILLGSMLVVGTLIFFYRVWEQDEAIRRVLAWAKANNYQIIDALSRRWASRPGHVPSSMLQMVFRVKIKDEDGRQREGWLRLGSYFLGLVSKEQDVFWDTAPAEKIKND